MNIPDGSRGTCSNPTYAKTGYRLLQIPQLPSGVLENVNKAVVGWN